MRRLPAATFATLLALGLAACTPGNPATGASPGASGAPAGTASPGASPAAGASPVAGASASPAAITGPVVANTGKFVFAEGQAPRYKHFVKGGTPEQDFVTVTIGKTTNGSTGFAVTSQQNEGAAQAERASGSFAADSHPYWGFIDLNLKSPELWAAGKVEGEETVAVPAGNFACTRTRYQKDVVTPSGKVDITLWTNGTVGLVKAQVSNSANFGATVLTVDNRFELEKLP